MKRMNNILAKNKFNTKMIDKRAEAIMNHPYVVKFLLNNQEEITQSQLRPFLSKLNQYIRELDHCKECPGLEKCPNLMRGHYPSLQAYAGNLDITMKQCTKLHNYYTEQNRKKLIQCHVMPKEVQVATFNAIEIDNNRLKAIDLAIEFCNQYIAGSKAGGLYLYGAFGVGKSYIAGAIANTLADCDIPVLMVHTPSLVNEMRDAIAEAMQGNRLSHTVSSKLELLGSTPVLVLDDIGTENYSAWIRDHVFGVILQNRISEQLPTIYTSNLTLDELEQALSWISNKGQMYEDKAGARRIMERIRPYVIPVEVGGRNRRYDK
ncbi:primosomal protein DnaI [Thermoactinomyces mirandus]|uniref:Primosomal protein DnaI n=1 Tax=Thermoactinomyces mirandus TaxID=2756294 RepID=A0A7W2ARQ4_9BACL|nr:primosomal protein DnaI [Thermoactinomyces mirandus]MBA4601641.1 primosomal protein DnaI [Thermoactinomyces mirandus]